jgi:hypothetical protein
MMKANLTEARKNLLKALRISFEANSIPIAMDSLLGLAQLYLQDGEPERVLELSYYIRNHPSSTQATKDRASALWAELETQLTPTQIEATQAQAAEKTLELVVRNLLANAGIILNEIE